MDFKNYFEELKRRKVFKPAIAYIATAWIIAQITADVLPIFEIPAFIQQTIIIILILGFPVTLVFAWIYDFTPKGIKKTENSEHTGHIKNSKTWKLNLAIISVLSIAILILLYNQLSSADNLSSKDQTSIESNDAIKNTIAVLPFKNWSGDPELEYISDGMADEIATKLERSKNMERVIPFREMLQYKESKIKLRELTDSLRVQFILDGSVQISGGQIRVKVQLLDGNDNRYIWSDEFIGNWDSKDVFAIQAKVTENILERINLNVDKEADSYKDYISTDNMEAYRSYLKGNYQRSSEVGVQKAIANYEKAVELDSSFIEAWYALGRTSPRSQRNKRKR